MRSARFGLLVPVLLFVTPIWAQQTTQTTTNPASDPQAVAVVQAAITALGGATAIGQVQTWELQALADGPIDNGKISDTISFEIPNDTIVINGVSRPTRGHIARS